MDVLFKQVSCDTMPEDAQEQLGVDSLAFIRGIVKFVDETKVRNRQDNGKKQASTQEKHNASHWVSSSGGAGFQGCQLNNVGDPLPVIFVELTVNHQLVHQCDLFHQKVCLHLCTCYIEQAFHKAFIPSVSETTGLSFCDLERLSRTSQRARHPCKPFVAPFIAEVTRNVLVPINAEHPHAFKRQGTFYSCS